VRRRAAIWAMLAIAALVYVEAGYGYGKPFRSAGEPSFLIRSGSDFAAARLLPSGTYINPGSGYDGQFTFFIAQDPLDRSAATDAHLDNPKYSYRRILLPLLGWATSAGDPDVLQWTLPLISLLAVIASGYVLARFLERQGLSPWLALLHLLSLGVMVGVLNDLPDALAASLFVTGLVFWSESRTLPALLLLGAAPFARELYVLPLLGIAVIELLRWRRAALAWLAPVLLFAAWNGYLELAFPHSLARTQTPSLLPLVGAFEKAREVVRTDVVGAANWELAFILLALLAWGYLAVRSWPLLRRSRYAAGWPARGEFVPLAGLLAIATVPFLPDNLWANSLSYVRYTAPVSGVLLLVFALRRDRWALWLAAAFFALTVVNPLIGLLPTNNGPLLAPV
jgi:hypothetical protein